MYIELDATELPLRPRLEDAEDLGAFKVLARKVDHVYVRPEEIRRLAGDRADAAWLEEFERMVSFAKSKGWVREDGAIRAHVEWLP